METLYLLEYYTSPEHLIFLPNPKVVKDSKLHPSPTLLSAIKTACKTRKPQFIGKATEDMAKELLDGSKLEIQGVVHGLECIQWGGLDLTLKPAFGIRCDDLLIIAQCESTARIFFTECKGTVTKRGPSRDVEAKARYQLMRTHNAALKVIEDSPDYTVGGTISFVADHYRKRVMMNILDSEVVIRGGDPDHWMYP